MTQNAILPFLVKCFSAFKNETFGQFSNSNLSHEVQQWNLITAFWGLRPSSSMPKCALRNIGHASSNVTNSSLRSREQRRKIVHFQHTVCTASVVVNLWVEKCLWHFAKDFHYHFGDSPILTRCFKHLPKNKERTLYRVL